MKFMFAVLLIIFGSILVGLTSNSLGATGNNIMHLAGIGCLIAAIFIAKEKKIPNAVQKRNAMFNHAFFFDVSSSRFLSSTFSYDYYKIESNSDTYSSKVVFNNETI
ncbi:hypothetical protein QJ133_04760 [Priestia megaterium]|uniref:hypothetical protein n=1 Tax=Priestia megaterium TaxID=1404 RepID=UPI00249AE6A9|nr:hypothetical protein [Priestia megaterium]MDI3090478.1 hypothetical protein [Priestia megaterium]